MRCTYYLPFEDKQGNALYRSQNGSPLNLIGRPQMRRQSLPGTSLGRGMEFAAPTTNLIPDGQFSYVNSSDVQWIANGSYSQARGGIFGPYVMRYTAVSGAGAGATTTGIGLKYATGLAASTTYHFSIYYRILNDAGVTWRAYVTGSYGGGGSILIADGKWHRWQVAFSYAASGMSIGIRVYNYSGTTSGNAIIEFDGYQAEQIDSDPTPFVSLANRPYTTVRSAQYAKIPTKGIMPGKSGGAIYLVFRPDWGSSWTFPANPVLMSLWYGSVQYMNIGYAYNDDKFRFTVRDTSWSYVESVAQSFSMGDRIMLVAQWNGSTANLYTNGVASGTGALTQYIPPYPDHIKLGANYDETGQPNAVFEEFAIFDEPLTTTMISRIYSEVVEKGLKLQDVGMI